MAIQNPVTGLSDFLPDSIGVWRPSEPDRFFNRENLYGYLDGGAELYLSYSFREGEHREFGNGSGSLIYADIFNMTESKNAFGVFSHSRETEEQEYGQGSQDYGDAIVFWKDRYLVSISSRGDDPQLKTIIAALANYIDETIRTTGDLPPIVRLMPEQGRVPASLMYFNHYLWQNSYCYLADENILNIDSSCDAALAKYKPGQDQLCLLLIRYPESRTAESSLGNLKSYFEMDVNLEAGDKESRWMKAGLKANYLAIVFHAGSRVEAGELLSSVMGNI